MSFEIESDVSDHARAYQLGRGRQLNVEHMYVGDRGLFPSSLSKTLLGSLVRESDPLELGVHRASMSSGNAVPSYVERDIDCELTLRLQTIIESGGFLLIIGDSTAGKSRTAYEALLRTVPDHRLVAPYDRAELRYSLADMATSAEKQVLWLDNLERFLGNDGLTPRIVSNLRYLKTILLGSIRSEQYRRLTRLSINRDETDSRTHNELIAAEHVLKQAEPIYLSRRWGHVEIGRAHENEDPRIAAALNHEGMYGIAEYLAAGPILYDEWRLGWDADQNPRGAALVAAAIDCHRAGLHDFLPLELLRITHYYYLDIAGGSLLRPESFEDALTWASKRRAGVTSLLLPGKENSTYRAFDYLTDRVMLTPNASPVPNVTWEAIRDYFAENANRLQEVATAAASQDNSDLAESIWQKLADQGSSNAARLLGVLYLRTNRDAEAEQSLERAVALGNLAAATTLGHLLTWNGKGDEAEQWYERAATGEDPHGMYHMGVICRNKGLETEAETWFRRAVEHKELAASSALGRLLVDSGKLTEAETLLRAAVDKGDNGARNYLGIVLADLDRTKEAEELWLAAASEDVPDSIGNLAILYKKQRRYPEAEKWFVKGIGLNVEGMRGAYGSMLSDRGQFTRARVQFEQEISSGDKSGYRHMGFLLLDMAQSEKAVKWLKLALDNGDDDEVIIGSLANALDGSGKSDEAVQYWRRLIKGGYSDASYPLGKIELVAGNVDEAIELFQKSAKNEDATSACELARIYWRQENRTVAEEWLKRSFNWGHVHAACLLGTFYIQQGDAEKAEEYWRKGYKGGHVHLASDISTLLISQGRGRDAAAWLRRATAGGAGGGRGRTGPPRRRRPKGRRR